MRLLRTSIATAAAVAITGTAFAATTNSVTATMGGTAHLQSGGKLTLETKLKTPSSKTFHVTIRFDVQVISTTVLGFAAYPCNNTTCIGPSVTTIKLGPGHRRVTFNGNVKVVRNPNSGKACVFAQLRDKGPKGKGAGQIVRAGKAPGVKLCK